MTVGHEAYAGASNRSDKPLHTRDETDISHRSAGRQHHLDMASFQGYDSTEGQAIYLGSGIPLHCNSESSTYLHRPLARKPSNAQDQEAFQVVAKG